MVTIYDVDVNKLIDSLALKLKEYEQIAPPDWAKYVKTGNFKIRPPEDTDWWYKRSAAILRSVFILGPIGVSKLRRKYGGKKDRGCQPSIFRRGSGNIIRKVLFQLGEAGLVEKVDKGKNLGRKISPKGLSLLDNTAKEVVSRPSKTDKLERPSKPAEKKDDTEKKEIKKETPKGE